MHFLPTVLDTLRVAVYSKHTQKDITARSNKKTHFKKVTLHGIVKIKTLNSMELRPYFHGINPLILRNVTLHYTKHKILLH